MSKSTTSTRSNSVESPPGENDNINSFPATPQQDCVNNLIISTSQTIMENNDTMTTSTNECIIIPTSPPPSYEHVLQETRMAAEQSSYTETSDNIANENCEENQNCDDMNNSSAMCSNEDDRDDYDDDEASTCNDEDCDNNDHHHTHHQHHHTHDCQHQQDCQHEQEQEQPPSPKKGPQILHKSSKELYKAVAKQFGITCKMSDQCRCLDCQSHYFECEYEENEQEKTDGGLGAGTPMFISEVMHGSACNIL